MAHADVGALTDTGYSSAVVVLPTFMALPTPELT